MKMYTPRPMLRADVHNLKVMVLSVAAGLLVAASTRAQTTPVSINPISYFQVQEGSSAVSWSQTSALVNSSGNSTITFQDGNGGTSTMVWSNTGVLSSWAINLASGATQVFTDGIGQGQPGSVALTAGAFGANNVLSINGHAYVPNGNFLMPAQISTGYGFTPPTLVQIAYGGTSYSYATTGTDYNGTSIGTFTNQAATIVVTANHGLQIYCPTGTCAVYSIDSTGRNYTYQASSSAANQLSQINGLPMTAFGNTLSLPLPISSFVWGGTTYTFSSIDWSAFSYLVGESGFLWEYSGGRYGEGQSNLDGSLQ